MERESFLNQPIKEKPPEMLDYLIDKFEIPKDLPEQERYIQAFARAYENQDSATGVSYRRKQAMAGYAEYVSTGVLPGYVNTTYKELKRGEPRNIVGPEIDMRGFLERMNDTDKKED